jgi:outer membrane protein assembly factor BamB
MGNIMAMDATAGHPVWWKTIGPNYNIDSLPSRSGSGMIWFYGISNFHAVDDSTNSLYISATNRGVNYFLDGIAGHKKTAPNTIQDGMRNGTIIAMDMRSGKVKWQLPTEFPPRVSPLVTGKIVFVGYIPFSEKDKTSRSGIVLALDKQTGSKLWEYDLHAPIGQVGPSIAGGMLFVPTGRIHENQDGGSTSGGGSIAAFGLP